MRCEESCCAPCAMSTYSSLLAKAGSRLRAGIHTFLWDEWSQLGISGITRRVSNWVADPEALLVFTIGASRSEVMRYLLLSAGEATALEVTESAGYAKRNVAEALNGLVKAQVVLARRRGEPEGLLG